MRNYLFILYFDRKMIQSAHIFLFGQNSFITFDYHHYIGQSFCVMNIQTNNYTFDEPFKRNNKDP